jgi:hypothetical protein
MAVTQLEKNQGGEIEMQLQEYNPSYQISIISNIF